MSIAVLVFLAAMAAGGAALAFFAPWTAAFAASVVAMLAVLTYELASGDGIARGLGFGALALAVVQVGYVCAGRLSQGMDGRRAAPMQRARIEESDRSGI